jgi:hypothetical protein
MPRRNPNRGCGGQLRRNRITDARRSIAFDPPRVPRACGRVFLETRWVSTSPVRAVPVSPHVVRPLVEAHDIRRDLQGTRVARQPHWFERRIECWPPVPRPLWRSKRPESMRRISRVLRPRPPLGRGWHDLQQSFTDITDPWPAPPARLGVDLTKRATANTAAKRLA